MLLVAFEEIWCILQLVRQSLFFCSIVFFRPSWSYCSLEIPCRLGPAVANLFCSKCEEREQWNKLYLAGNLNSILYWRHTVISKRNRPVEGFSLRSEKTTGNNMMLWIVSYPCFRIQICGVTWGFRELKEESESRGSYAGLVSYEDLIHHF